MATTVETLDQAFLYHKTGHWREAERLYRQVLDQTPGHADAHHLLGVLAYQVGQFEVAAQSIRQALALNPGAAMYWSNLGFAQERLGQIDQAVTSYRQAVQLQPDFVEAHSNLGAALKQLGQWKEAESHCRWALHYRPAFADAYNNLGNIYLETERVDDAIACYRQALQSNPNYAKAWNNLGNALAKQDKLDEAAQAYQQALRHDPNFAPASYNLGNVWQRQDKLDLAMDCYRQALRLNPNYEGAHNNLGNLHKELVHFEEALGCYEQAVRCDPANPYSHLNRGLLLLLLGQWAEGWPEFEWRWRTEEFARHLLAGPRWDGSNLDGRTVLLTAEQGVGDTLQFIRYVSLVAQRGGKAMVQCQPALARLLAKFPGIDRLISAGEPLPPHDFQAPLLSLPGIARSTVDTIPTAVPYLHADPKLVAHWQRELEPLGGFKVGIAWQGSLTYLYDHQRSIPLAHFAPLARVEGVRLVSLQKGLGTEQLQALAGQFAVVDLGDRLDESNGAFMDTAAVMMNLDLVISSDTSVPHLAGALAVPVWVALPAVPDWRWLLQREDCPWYPTMRLFRQRRPGEWLDVFERMAGELGAAIKAKRS